MTAEDEEPLTSELAALGGRWIDDSGPEDRVAGFKDALRRLRENPAEAARIDAIAAETDREDHERHSGPQSGHAAQALSLDQLARAVLAAGTISGDTGTVVRAVILYRPVAEIFALADMLRGASAQLAAAFLDEVAAGIPGRGAGSEAAAMIDGFLDRAPGRGLARLHRGRAVRMGAAIEQIGGKRDPAQLADLITGLRERGRYAGLREDIQDAVARHYQTADLIALIRACQQEQLPAALSIMQAVLLTPRTVRPQEIPMVIAALRQAGASSEALRELLAFIAGRRTLDSEEILAALRQRGMDQEARWIRRVHPGERAPSGLDDHRPG
jgi:hypothetical protein